MERYLEPLSALFYGLRIIAWLSLLICGIMIIIKALLVFGIDYMAVVYLYFPEESEVQENEIYSVIRHPTYAGLIYISFSGFFFSFTIYSLVAFLLTVGFFSFHIHFIEERELIQRFGKNYKEYMNKTSAFFPKPKNSLKLLKFAFKN
ncbi:MAG: methyltransferase family protein [Promethearchaeota archaeon]